MSEDVNVKIKFGIGGSSEVDSEAFTKGESNDINMRIAFPGMGKDFDKATAVFNDEMMQTFSHEMGHVYSDLFSVKEGLHGYKKRDIDILSGGNFKIKGGRAMTHKDYKGSLAWMKKESYHRLFESTDSDKVTLYQFKKDIGFCYPLPYRTKPYNEYGDLYKQGKLLRSEYIGWAIWGQKPGKALQAYSQKVKNEIKNWRAK
jgi:hypothetical protein